MDRSFNTASEEETAQVAAGLAPALPEGSLLCLWGDLGMGKSVFARALIRTLAGEPALDVPSPTYTLVQTYETPAGEIFHFDLYRLSAPEEIYELGWEDALPEGIVIVEWPERLGGFLPARRIDVRIGGGAAGPDSRRIEVSHAG